MPHNVVYLIQLYGDNTIVTDTTFVTEDKKAAFLIDDSYEQGMYRLLFGDNRYVDFIHCGENVDMVTYFDLPVDCMTVVASAQNRMLYGFYKLTNMFERKSEYLIPLVRFYPVKDEFYKNAEKEYNHLQKERDEYITAVQKKFPESFVSKILQVQREPIIDTRMSDEEKVQFYQDHYFDYVDFNDTMLFYSNALTSKVIGFLKLFRDQSLPKHTEQAQFITGVDMLMTKLHREDAAYNFILEYLVKGFEKFQYDEVLEHIASHYKAAAVCEDEERRSQLEKTLDFYKKTAIGQKAPDILLKDSEGKDISMSSLENDIVLLMFWSTTCPHCHELLPQLKEFYDKGADRKYEIFAVSIDQDVDVWKKFILENEYGWINVNESNGWDNKVLNDYNIYATPTFLILDKNRNIIGKPVTMEEIKSALGK
ncbi:MAG: TlpA disulfide reductase family protein [Bacteroidota bacterium]